MNAKVAIPTYPEVISVIYSLNFLFSYCQPEIYIYIYTLIIKS